MRTDKKRLVQAIYIGSQNMRHDPRFQLFMEPRNNQYLVHLSMDIIPELISPLLEGDAIKDETGVTFFNESLSLTDIARWIVMQIYSIATFGPVGKTEKEEKAFIEKLVIPGLFSWKMSLGVIEDTNCTLFE